MSDMDMTALAERSRGSRLREVVTAARERMAQHTDDPRTIDDWITLEVRASDWLKATIAKAVAEERLLIALGFSTNPITGEIDTGATS